MFSLAFWAEAPVRGPQPGVGKTNLYEKWRPAWFLPGGHLRAASACHQQDPLPLPRHQTSTPHTPQDGRGFTATSKRSRPGEGLFFLHKLISPPESSPGAPGAGLVSHPTYTPHAVLVSLTSIMGAGAGEEGRGQGWKGSLAFSSIFSLACQAPLEMQSTCYFRLGLVHAFGLERNIQIQPLKINIPLQA